VYQPDPGGPVYLVAEDGTQYQVPLRRVEHDFFSEEFRNVPLSLSPDGRWLLSVEDDETRVRDLTGTGVRALGRLALPMAWSPDGRWLIYSALPAFILLDVESGQSWPLGPHGPSGGENVALDSGGRLVRFPPYGEHRVNLVWADPVHGGDGRPVVVEAGGLLGPTESLVWRVRVGTVEEPQCEGTSTWMSPLADDRLLIGVYERVEVLSCPQMPAPVQVSYLVVAATTGQVTGLLRLPAGAGEPSWYGDDVAYPTQASPSDRVELALVTPTGASLGRLTSLPAGATFVLAGARRSYVGPATD
jgi:hypothetical protein